MRSRRMPTINPSSSLLQNFVKTWSAIFVLETQAVNIKDFCFSRRLQTFIDRHGIKFEDVLLAVRNAAEQQQQQ